MKRLFFLLLLFSTNSLLSMEAATPPTFATPREAADFLKQRGLHREQRLERAKNFENQHYNSEFKEKTIKHLNLASLFLKPSKGLKFTDSNERATDFALSNDDTKLTIGTSKGRLLLISLNNDPTYRQRELKPKSAKGNVRIIDNMQWNHDASELMFQETRNNPLRIITYKLDCETQAYSKQKTTFPAGSSAFTRKPGAIATISHNNHFFISSNPYNNQITIQSLFPKKMQDALNSLSWPQIAALTHYAQAKKRTNYDLAKHPKLLKILHTLPADLKNLLNLPLLKKAAKK